MHNGNAIINQGRQRESEQAAIDWLRLSMAMYTLGCCANAPCEMKPYKLLSLLKEHFWSSQSPFRRRGSHFTAVKPPTRCALCLMSPAWCWSGQRGLGKGDSVENSVSALRQMSQTGRVAFSNAGGQFAMNPRIGLGSVKADSEAEKTSVARKQSAGAILHNPKTEESLVAADPE
jgi:hypothetical protein